MIARRDLALVPLITGLLKLVWPADIYPIFAEWKCVNWVTGVFYTRE